MLKIVELFGGIGACSKALEKLGIDFEIVDYVEIDKFAVKSFNAIHGTNFEAQDICNWDKDLEVDLIMHGSPCQDFSLAGKHAGGDQGSGTRSSLMYETLRIVEKLKPKYIIWENVKNILSKTHVHNFNNYIKVMDQLGYRNYYEVLNSKNYGIPQNRERVFTISIRNDIIKDFKFPEKQDLKLKLKDLLEEEVDEKYYLTKQAIEGRLTTNYYKYKLEKNVINDKEIHPTILARYEGAPTLFINNNTKKGYIEAHPGDGVYTNTTTKRGTVQNQIIQTLTSFQDKGVVLNDLKIRRLTPKECWRLMGFEDEDFEKASKVCSNTQLYKQAGNSIVVNVLMEILKNLLR